MNELKVFMGRITVFPAVSTSSPLPSSSVLYRGMWGDDPDSYQKQANPLAPSVAQGKQDGITTNCLVQPTRIDFSFVATATEQTMGELAVIEQAEKVTAELTRMIAAIGRGAISLDALRVALFVHLLARAKDHEQANSVLMKTIPYGLRISNEEDMILQINHPYRSRQLQGVEMNSITKWSVDRFQVMTISISGDGPTGPTLAGGHASQPQIQERLAASVTFDINNRAVQAPLTSGHQASLLLEALDTVSRTQREIGLNLEGL
jgi:hypothetical protein